jgi:hypothetical protein
LCGTHFSSPLSFISIRLCFCGKCLSFPAMCQNNPLPNTRCGSRNRACPSQETTPLSRKHKITCVLLNHCCKLCENKASYHFTQDISISCFTFVKTNKIHEISFEHFTLKQDCHFTQDISISCFTFVKTNKIHEISFERFTLKQDCHFTQDISISHFTFVKTNKIHEISFEHFTLKQDCHFNENISISCFTFVKTNKIHEISFEHFTRTRLSFQ